MKRIVLSGLLAFAASTGWALAPARGDRIGILETSEVHLGRMERAISNAMPRVLREELRRVGFDVRLLTKTIDEQQPGESPYDFLIEVIYDDAEGGYLGGVGAGVPVGSVGVGAEVAVAYAQVDARLLLYDARSLDLIRTFDLQARSTSPTLSGVGVGHREGFIFLHLPFTRSYTHKKVTRALARSAAAQIAAQ